MSQNDEPTGRPAEGSRQAPRLTEQGRDRAAERRARQAEALRANLRRRKAQVRAREQAAEAETKEG